VQPPLRRGCGTTIIARSILTDLAGESEIHYELLGLRALYFVLQGALSKLVHLGFGLAAILGFIGVKLVLHWAHLVWPAVPEIPTLASLGVIVGILVVTTLTSLAAAQATTTTESAPRP